MRTIPSIPAGPSESVVHPRVLIIAENASEHFGGEAVLPLHYFRVMRKRGIPVWMIVNQRNEAELRSKLSTDDLEHLFFVPDSPLHRALHPIAERLPASVASFTIGQLVEVIDQRRSLKLAETLHKQYGFTVIHQPTPVSPKHVSLLWNRGSKGLGLPVVMGPMNGGITYPSEFRSREHPMDRAFVTVGRLVAGWVHRLFPGKLRAETLMVANDRTLEALPAGVRGKIEHVVENGVDLTLYRSRPRHAAPDAAAPVRLVFAGRLVGFKGVDLLLKAMAIACTKALLHLDILGDGPCRGEWERLARELGIEKSVTFHGWMSHQDCAQRMGDSDVFVLPSLRECGGAVVLEAMAMKLPVIAANWGGPADYVDPSCGVLVNVDTSEQFVRELAEAIVHLAQSPSLRAEMGDAGFNKVLLEYDWERKVDRVLGVYSEAMVRANSGQSGALNVHRDVQVQKERPVTV